MTKKLCLIRHADSVKNTHEVFDDQNARQDLTLRGQVELSNLVVYLRELTANVGASQSQLYSANSERAEKTAQAIGTALSLKPATIANLGSMRSGPLSGLSETEAALRFPEYMKTLKLYRSGLLSSDKILRPEGCETLNEFENRITTCFDEILSSEARMVIVVGHRSPISAMCVSLARRYLGYPDDFFGYIPIPTGSVTLFNFAERTFEYAGMQPGT
ncbi:histidine phosphatase family protein [Thalassospira marina]|nr:histidine phosphatase family protein [Thalassospira marina]